MNGLLRIKCDSALTDILPFKEILYFTLLSDVFKYTENGVDYLVTEHDREYIVDRMGDEGEAVEEALQELEKEGRIIMDDEGFFTVGQLTSGVFVPFSKPTSLYQRSFDNAYEAVKNFLKGKKALHKVRGEYLLGEFEKLSKREVERYSIKDFGVLHEILYEVYMGGESYKSKGKADFHAPSRILQRYDKPTTFAIIVEATLNYHKYRHKGVPTLTTVGYLADDVMGALSKSSTPGSKEYLRSEEEESDGF